MGIESPLISVVVPAYNEAERIAKTLKEIAAYFDERKETYEILVVDDGSRDKTTAVVEDLHLPNCRVINYGTNRGKGYAVNFGVKNALGEWILFTDADNSTPINQFEHLHRQTDSHQVIIGSRYLKDSRITIRQGVPRIVMGRLGNLLVQLLVLPGLHDTQCGFKLFSRRAAQEIFALQTIWRWGFDMEILRIAKDHGYKIKEVPITWQNDEQSRIQSSRVFVKTLFELFAIKRNSLLGRYKKSGRSDAGLLLRFAGVGVIGTVIDYTILIVTHQTFGWMLIWASTVGFLAGAVNNYLFNSFWTFEQKLTWNKFYRFISLAVVGLILNDLIVVVLSDSFDWNFKVAKLLAIFVVFFWNFLANKRWTFD